MVVQTSTDEQKLNFLRQNVQKRPLYMPTHDFTIHSNVLTGGSSDEVDSLFDQSPNRTARTSLSSMPMNANDIYQGRSPAVLKSTDSLITMQNETDRQDNNHRKSRVDCASVTSSEWGGESEIGEPTSQGQNTSKKRTFKQINFFFNVILLGGSRRSLSSRVHLAGSIQSLRDAVHRIPKPRLSASRTSLDSEQQSNAEISDRTSTKIEDKQNKTSMYPTWSSG